MSTDFVCGPSQVGLYCVITSGVVGWERVPHLFAVVTLLEDLYFSFQNLCVARGAA